MPPVAAARKRHQPEMQETRALATAVSQQVHLLGYCWGRSISSSREANSNCRLLSVLHSLHLNSGYKSLNCSCAITIAMTTFLCWMALNLYIQGPGSLHRRLPICHLLPPTAASQPPFNLCRR